MNDDQHYCMATVCKAEISKALLMCPRHWSMVPNAMKNAVNRTWRAWRFNLLSPEKVREYQAARREAIAIVDALEAGAPV